MDPQVHGGAERPRIFAPEVELMKGDVRDAETLARHLLRADVVVHFAAAVGVGQSMYDIRRYTDVNSMGVATLMQLLADDRGKVRKLPVPSSMSIYGEGAYQCPEHGLVEPVQSLAGQEPVDHVGGPAAELAARQLTR